MAGKEQWAQRRGPGEGQVRGSGQGGGRRGRGGAKVERWIGEEIEGIRKWVEGLTREWKDRRNG